MTDSEINQPDVYQPDYAVPPGRFVAEILEEREWTVPDLVHRCDYSIKLIGDIIDGTVLIDSDTARRFERILNVDARIWVNMEARYREALARQSRYTP